tara:strand:- start:10682 stop:10885 length:204 start_codon:yes stop_codon:yes gene_type:complete
MSGPKENTYVFSVPATYTYEVDADTEDEARNILEEAGGLDLLGELCDLSRKDYRNAVLEESFPNDGK